MVEKIRNPEIEINNIEVGDVFVVLGTLPHGISSEYYLKCISIGPEKHYFQLSLYPDFKVIILQNQVLQCDLKNYALRERYGFEYFQDSDKLDSKIMVFSPEIDFNTPMPHNTVSFNSSESLTQGIAIPASGTSIEIEYIDSYREEQNKTSIPTSKPVVDNHRAFTEHGYKIASLYTDWHSLEDRLGGKIIVPEPPDNSSVYIYSSVNKPYPFNNQAALPGSLQVVIQSTFGTSAGSVILPEKRWTVVTAEEDENTFIMSQSEYDVSLYVMRRNGIDYFYVSKDLLRKLYFMEDSCYSKTRNNVDFFPGLIVSAYGDEAIFNLWANKHDERQDGIRVY